jgi:hypothetical protein
MCFGFVSYLSLFSHPLFAWSWTAHHELTVAALSGAMGALQSRGVLNRLQQSAADLKSSLSSLWIMDNCQDITLGNAVPTVATFLTHVPLIGTPLREVGICGVEVPGGQITHFMRDHGQDPHAAYKLAYEQIWNTACRAWSVFKSAYPPPEQPHHHGGLLGVLEKVYEYSPVGLAVKGVKAIVHEGEKLGAEYYLGRALHTLQDSFSPAHTQRVFGDPWVILDIYEYSMENRNPHPGFPGHPGLDWPGHAPLDHPNTNTVSPPLRNQALVASQDLITAVLGNLFNDQGAFIGELRSVLFRHLAWRF